MAVAYDTPINGYNTNTTINLRLWKATPFAVTAFSRWISVCRNSISLPLMEGTMYLL